MSDLDDAQRQRDETKRQHDEAQRKLDEIKSKLPPYSLDRLWEIFNSWWGPTLLSAAVLAAAIFSAIYFPEEMVTKGHAPYVWVGHLAPEMGSNLNLSLPAASTNENMRFAEQVQHLSNRAKHHFSVMQFFYLNYYMQIMLACIFGGLSAISLFLLTKAGWEKANRYLVSFFLMTTVCTAFFLAFPNVCKMDENVAKNKALWLKYISLLDDARTFAAITNYVQVTPQTNTITPSRFILYLDEEMRKANDIVVSFDPTKYPNYNKALTEKSAQ